MVKAHYLDNLYLELDGYRDDVNDTCIYIEYKTIYICS